MSDHVQWIIRLSIDPDQLGSFKSVMADMIASTKEEAGALAYEWHFNADETECVIYERYVDSEAAVLHFRSFDAFAERFGSVCTPQNMLVLGTPNQAAQDFLDRAGPEYLSTAAGFSKFST